MHGGRGNYASSRNVRPGRVLPHRVAFGLPSEQDRHACVAARLVDTTAVTRGSGPRSRNPMCYDALGAGFAGMLSHGFTFRTGRDVNHK